jgi:hypothetical protein
MLLPSSRFPILGVNGGLLSCMSYGYLLLLETRGIMASGK